RHTSFSRDWSSDMCSSDLPGRDPDHPAVLGIPSSPPLLRVVRRIDVDPDVVEGWAIPLEAAHRIVEHLPDAVGAMREALGVSLRKVAADAGVTEARLRAVIGGAEPTRAEVSGLYEWLRREVRAAAGV